MHPLLRKLFFLLQLLYCLLFAQLSYAQASCAVTIATDNGVDICAGNTTTITGTADFTATVWDLYRDDVKINTNSTGIFPVSQSGDYYVQATGVSCVAAKSNTFTITVYDEPSTPEFFTNPDITVGDICGGDQILFSIKNPEPDVVYNWSFGDQQVATGAANVPHTYTAIGTGTAFFTVRVEAVRQPGGCSSTYTQSIRIKESPEISFTETNNFQICLREGLAPKDTTIYAEIQNTTATRFLSDIRNYYIDWGDGKGEIPYPGQPDPFPLKSPNPYDSLGNYPIKIRAVNTNGCDADTFKAVFRYSQKPKAHFTLNKEPAATPQSCTPIIVALGDSTTGGNLTYKWTVKEPNNGGYTVQYGGYDQDSLRLLFENPGIFNVELIVENSCGSDTTEQSIIVGYPQAQLSGDIVACGDTTIKYNAQNVFYDPNFGNTVTYQWFVDGQQVSAEQYPSIDFPARATPYDVEVKITNECGTSDDVQKMPPQRVTVNQVAAVPVVTNLSACNGDVVTIQPSGPGPAYNFYSQATGGAPLNAAPAPSYTTPALTGTATYYVETVNPEGCPSDRVPVLVTVGPALDNNTITATQEAVCTGDAPALITGSTATGGTGTIIYTWQQSTTGPSGGFSTAPGANGNTSYTPTAISNTTWFRRIVTTGQCSADTSNVVQITAVPLIQDNTISEAQDICEGELPAPLTGPVPTGGSGALMIRWEISTVSADDEESFVPAPAPNNTQNYTFTVPLTQDTWVRRVVESNGCSMFSDPIKISVYPELENNVVQEAQEICKGTQPKALLGSAPTGGNGNYTYLWESSTSQNPDDASFADAAGTNNAQSYTPGALTVTTWFRRTVFSAGCKENVSAPVLIRVNEGITNNSITGAQQVCEGLVPEPLTGTQPGGGNGALSWQWVMSTTSETGAFFPAPGDSKNADYTPPAVRQNAWFRRVVSSAGCADTSDAILITMLPRPAAPTLAARDVAACTGGSASLEVSNALAGIKYRWYTEETGGAYVFEGVKYQVFDLMQSVTYYVEAVNENDCASTVRIPVQVNVTESGADAGEDVTIIQGRTTELQATGGDTYKWEPATGLSNPDVANPVARPEKTTTYTLTVTAAGGCTSTDEVTVEVIPAINARNAFTPNRDDVNETWEIENIRDYPEARVEVFNRWGNLVFSSDGYATPWDGTLDGKDLPVATYYYIIYLNKTEKPISGNVTIIR